MIFLALLPFILFVIADNRAQFPCVDDKKTTVEYPGDCTKFYYCLNGTAYTVQCHSGYYYNASASGCVNATSCPQVTATTTTTTTTTTTPPPTPVPPCKTLDTTILENTSDCKQFTLCINGVPHVALCLAGYYYSAADKGCIKAAQCPQGTTTTTTTTTTRLPPTIAAPCKSMEETTIAIPSDCSAYVLCKNGRPYIALCPNGEFYSAVHMGCVKTSQCPQH